MSSTQTKLGTSALRRSFLEVIEWLTLVPEKGPRPEGPGFSVSAGEMERKTRMSLWDTERSEPLQTPANRFGFTLTQVNP